MAVVLTVKKMLCSKYTLAVRPLVSKADSVCYRQGWLLYWQWRRCCAASTHLQCILLCSRLTVRATVTYGCFIDSEEDAVQQVHTCSASSCVQGWQCVLPSRMAVVLMCCSVSSLLRWHRSCHLSSRDVCLLLACLLQPSIGSVEDWTIDEGSCCATDCWRLAQITAETVSYIVFAGLHMHQPRPLWRREAGMGRDGKCCECNTPLKCSPSAIAEPLVFMPSFHVQVSILHDSKIYAHISVKRISWLRHVTCKC